MGGVRLQGQAVDDPGRAHEGHEVPHGHIVPLAAQTIDALEMLHEITGEGELLFPGDWSTVKT